MIMPILYFTSLILVGISLGSLIYLGYKDTKLTGFSRFLIGFSLTPFAISLFTLSFGLVFNKAHQLWFFIIPIVISVIYLKLFGEPGIKGFFEDVKNYWTKLSLIDKLLWVPMLEFIILILVVIVKVTYSYPIVEAHDAGVYMNEALHFVEERKIPNFSTANEGLSPGHPHSALYMGYLANGLFASGNETFGFPNDKIAIVGARLILIFLIAATFSLLHNIEELKKYLALPFLIYFLLNPVNNLILFFMDNISRDPFRIIPLILLFTVTSSYLRVVKNYRFLLRDYLLILTLTTFGIWGHTINIIIVGLIILTWIFLSFYSKRETKLVVSVVFSVAFGFCIAGIHYLRSFIDTGRLMGNGFYYYFWEGTALWDAFTNTTRYNSRLNLNLIERLRNLLMLNDAYGYIVIFVIVFFLIKKLKKDINIQVEIFYLTILLCVLTIPYTGIFDFEKMKLSEMFLLNYRYRSHWVLFGSILISYFIFYLSQKYRLTKYLSVLIVLIVSYLSSYTLVREYVFKVYGDYEKSKKYTVYLMMEELPQESKVLIDNVGMDYYIKQNNLFIYDIKAWSIVHAKSVEETSRAMRDLGVTHVLLSREIEGWWDQIPLYDYVLQHATTVQGGFSKKYNLNLYKINN